MTANQAAAFYAALQQIVRHSRARDEDAVCHLGISVRECHALELLNEQPLSLNGLAAPLGLDKSTASRLVQRLVAEKLVTRKIDQRDSRAVVLVLTAKGRKLYETALSESLVTCKSLLQRIPASKREQVVEALELTARLLEESDGCCAAE